LGKEVATHLALDHHIKEAQVLAMVANLLDLVVDPIHLKASFPQPLVVLVAKDLLEV